MTAPTDARPRALVLWDDELAELPLLDLANDVACQHGGLDVDFADLPAGLNGVTATRGRDVVILLQRRTPAIHATWAHELAHAIDFLDHRVRHGARSRREVDRRESFADRLGGMLLEHHPRSLRDAGPLIATVRSRG